MKFHSGKGAAFWRFRAGCGSGGSVPLFGGTSTSTATVVQSVRGISNEMELQPVPVERWRQDLLDQFQKTPAV